MGVKIVNVVHPITRKTTHVKQRPDGLWETPDGIVMAESEIQSDSGDGGILVLAFLFGIGLLIYQIIISLI